MNTRKPRRNLSTVAPLTPMLPATTEESFAARQQLELTTITTRLASLESRYNGQQRLIQTQSDFISLLKGEGRDLRVRLRFLENAAKLPVGPK